MDGRKVFVIYGRNEAARSSLFAFLRAIDLVPLEWSQIVAKTGKGSPYIGEVLDKGFEIAQAVVALMTPDDVAKLRKQYHGLKEPAHETELTGQPRQNVLFEAGMAMGKDEDRTIIVEIGDLRPMSDTLGRHVIRMNNSQARRQELAQRLETAGCKVDRSGTAWHSEGDFEAGLPVPDDQEDDIRGDLAFVQYRDGLSDTELYWIVQAVANREQTIHGYINDMTPKSLVTKGFLERVGPEPMNKMQTILYNIPPDVWTYLVENEVSLLEQTIAKNQTHLARMEKLLPWLRAAEKRANGEQERKSETASIHQPQVEAEQVRAQNEADAIRLAQFRAALIQHADRVPTGRAFKPPAGEAWIHGADKILEIVAYAHIRNIFHRSAQTEHEIAIAAASLRAIAARVKVDDLWK